MNNIPVDFNNWGHSKELVGDDIFNIEFKNSNKKIIKIFTNQMVDNKYINDDTIYKVFMQTEPRSLQAKTLDNIEKNSHLFDLILAHDEKLLLLPNSVLFQPLKTYFWVRPPCYSNIVNYFHKHTFVGSSDSAGNDSRNYNYKENKEFMLTMLCGHKKTAFGNRLRIHCWNKQNEIKIPKRCYKSHTMRRRGRFETKIFKDNISTKYRTDKSELFIDSMFHVAIENSSHKNYFTEKLTDCILTHTIPIYWGCPNISDFYNAEGFVIFKDENDFIKKVNELTPEFYYSKLNIVNENYERFVNIKETRERLKDILSNIN